MTNEQENEMKGLLDIFNKTGLLPYIVLIGSWSEYFYAEMLDAFVPSIRTTDIDFYFPRSKRPTHKIDIFSSLRAFGYIYDENPIDNTSRFFKSGGFEIEFLTHLNKAQQNMLKIDYAGINAICLGKLDVFTNRGKIIQWPSKQIGITVNLLSPATYVIQKLIINCERKIEKQDKDYEAIKNILSCIHAQPNYLVELHDLYKALSKKQKKAINDTLSLHIDNGEVMGYLLSSPTADKNKE